MSTSRGRYIQVDGIDGAGKSTLLKAARDWFEESGFRTFDAVAWSKEHGRLPTPDDVRAADATAMFTAEPTHVGIGQVIRNTLIRTGVTYNARSAASAFALDREIQLRELIIPFLDGRPDAWVIQDRGLLSSLAYQPLQSEKESDPRGSLSVVDIAALEGNRLALEWRPDAFVFVDIDPAIAQARLAGRTDKQDDVRFETADFQSALSERYHRPDVRTPFEERGTRIVTIDGSKSREEVAAAMRQALQTQRPSASS